MKTAIGFTMVCLALVYAACKKSVSKDPRFDGSIQIKLSTEGLLYVKLNTGKYFIYKDSASATLDSVIVTKSVVENVFTPATSGLLYGIPTTYAAYNTEVYSLTLSKVEAGGNQSVWLQAASKSALCCPSRSENNYGLSLFDVNKVVVFSYPTNQLLPSVVIEGRTYTDVVRSVQQGNFPGTFYRAELYWAKGIGIIKKTYTVDSTTKTHTLIRYN